MDSDSHSEDGSVEEIDETVTTETNCGNATGPRSARNNPFLVNDEDEDQDSDDALESEESPNDDVSKPDNEPPSLDSAFVDSMCQSEVDSIDLKVSETLTSSMMTSGVEVLDSSDIEIIREDRGSADSIEILESSVSMTTSSDRRTDSPAAHEHGDETLLDSSVIDSPTLECSTSNGVDHSSPPEVDNGLPTQDAGDTTTLKSGSSNDVESRGDTPVSNTSDSSHSGALPNVGYSKLQESNPSSYSPSPYDSPTHVTALLSAQSQTPAPSCDTTEHARPESLSLPRSLQLCDRQRLAKKESYSSLSEYSSRSGSMDMLIEAVTSTPLHAQGTVSVEGEMTTFIAHGFNELIKKGKENPAAIWVNEVAPRSRSSSSISSTTSGWSASVASRATRSPSSVYTQSPDDIPPIDPKALFDVEMHARKVAENLDTLMLGLVGKLHKMSATTLSSLDVYKEAVDKTCDSVDANIKSMYALMAKCEELNRTMRPVYRIQDQIKEIKRLLDLFEAQVSDDEP